jgi:hypothetical protein
MAVFWVVAPCSLVEVYRRFRDASENFYPTTGRNNPEDSHFHTRCRENLKSHKTKGDRRYENALIKGLKCLTRQKMLNNEL